MKRLKYFENKNLLEAGCDESGRGCLSGPVFAAAVILPKKKYISGLNDSKKLTPKRRMQLRKIIENQALAYAVAQVSPSEIDEINILQASLKAMHMAIDQLILRPQHVLIDGNIFNPYPKIPHSCIIRGDSKYASIAAASILAKTYRDEYMQNLHLEFPYYHWHKNKGYPTLAHRKAILERGSCVHHRMSFRLLLPTPLKTD